MKLTKKQKQEMYNRHSGSGTIFINISPHSYTFVDINLGRDGNWYAGNGKKTVTELLQGIKEEIALTLEE